MAVYEVRCARNLIRQFCDLPMREDVMRKSRFSEEQIIGLLRERM